MRLEGFLARTLNILFGVISAIWLGFLMGVGVVGGLKFMGFLP